VQVVKRVAGAGKRLRVGLSLLFPLAVFALIGYAIASHSGDLTRVVKHASIDALILVTVLGLLALLARAEMAVACLEAMGDRPSRWHIHAASALGFVVSTVNHYIVTPVRASLLKRLDRERAPTIPQMILVDGSTYLIEGLLAAVVLLACAGTLRLRWWMPVIALVGLLAAVVVAVRLRTALARYPMFHGFAMLTAPRSRATVIVLALLIFVVQILRTLVALHTAGLHATVLQSAATFVASGVLSALLAGPAAGAAAAPLLVFGTHHVGRAAVAGIMLAGTMLIASISYSLVTLPILGHRRAPVTPVQRSAA
jgi:hypothetical protein